MKRMIKTAGVIGSGIMGGGIAALLASAGIRTLLLDIVPPGLPAGPDTDKKARNQIVQAGLDAVLNARPALLMQKKDAARIQIGNLEDDFERLADCDWIVEVVVENLGVKQGLLERLEAVRKPGAIVSSNTSGIPLAKMSAGRSDDFRKHFLGTHFFNPVRYMKLLEIIPGEETLPEIISFMAAFGEKRLGKGIVMAKDTPNFVGNRIGVQGIVRAMQLMVADGLTIPEVDTLFGPAMGRPKTGFFKTADLVGLDTLVHVAENTFELVPDDERRDSFKVPEFINAMVQKKLLGKKTKSGFYKKDLTPEWKTIRKVINPQTLEYEEYQWPSFPCLEAAKKAKTLPEKIKAIVYADDKGGQYAWKALAENLIYAANRIPEIADTIVEIDNAMKWGFNFTLGPFETWDAIGVARSVAKMEADGLVVPAPVKKMLAAGHATFYKNENGQTLYYDFAAGAYQPVAVSAAAVSLHSLKASGKVVKSCPSASLVDLGDDVFCVEFHTKMNAINGEIIDFMADGIDYIEKNGIGLVIGNQAGGMPGAFSAGGDLKFMGELARSKKWAEMESFLEKAQQGLQRARYASLPVVAAPYGLTLGGGCEICLGAADMIVAHAELYMGLVEIGVGLLPAGGGCLNLWKKMTQHIPAPVKLADLAPFFLPTFMNIAMARVSTSAADAGANGFLGPVDRIIFNRDYLIGEAKKEVLKMVDDGYVPPVKKPIRVMGTVAQGMVNAELHNMKEAGFVSAHDMLLARRIAFVISGGDVRANARIDEDVILKLEREAFIDFWKEEKTVARVEHMLKTGKPLRN
ncbi:MAG: 3-hydroxyacyl-CoA dehydrogenase/enoyl-CoA hydratase family protein [Deltaproteobacteria bacterium]|nr:MAG: 3-hydroxyacyl-CoA dehydrogenase/enoyl-CoA hydratase family protein [Deltaproteobacteria bacterium]